MFNWKYLLAFLSHSEARGLQWINPPLRDSPLNNTGDGDALLPPISLRSIRLGVKSKVAVVLSGVKRFTELKKEFLLALVLAQLLFQLLP